MWGLALAPGFMDAHTHDDALMLQTASLRRFNGAATADLENHLGWFRALDRTLV